MPDDSDLQTARALGELSAKISAIAQQLDLLHSDFTAKASDLQAQVHEVKHDHRQQMQVHAIIGERLSNHLKTDEENHAIQIREIRENRTANIIAIERSEGEVRNEIGAIAASVEHGKAKVEELLTWRNRILGGLAMLGILLTVFGRDMVEMARHLGEWFK